MTFTGVQALDTHNINKSSINIFCIYASHHHFCNCSKCIKTFKNDNIVGIQKETSYLKRSDDVLKDD